MALTPKELEEVERIRNNPYIELSDGLTDEEVLAQSRFIEEGDGIDIYDSEEAYREAMKKQKDIDEIKEV